MGTSPPPEFDAAAEAARFCARAAHLASLRRMYELHDLGAVLVTPVRDIGTSGYHRVSDALATEWSLYEAAGGTLAELYGLEPAR